MWSRFLWFQYFVCAPFAAVAIVLHCHILGLLLFLAHCLVVTFPGAAVHFTYALCFHGFMGNVEPLNVTCGCPRWHVMFCTIVPFSLWFSFSMLRTAAVFTFRVPRLLFRLCALLLSPVCFVCGPCFITYLSQFLVFDIAWSPGLLLLCSFVLTVLRSCVFADILFISFVAFVGMRQGFLA